MLLFKRKDQRENAAPYFFIRPLKIIHSED